MSIPGGVVVALGVCAASGAAAALIGLGVARLMEGGFRRLSDRGRDKRRSPDEADTGSDTEADTE